MPTVKTKRAPTEASAATFVRRRAQITAQIDRALLAALPAKARVPAPLYAAMHYCLFTGGKRFRPLLVLMAAEAVGSRAASAMPVACAVEMIHTYSLAHDDLPAMDNADERRGHPSCHRKFDEATAILVGDALLTLAFELLGRAKTDNVLGILRTLGEASGTIGLIGGQVMDLAAIRHPETVKVQTLIAVAERKTGALITASVVCGALAGGAKQDQARRLRRYGQHVGLAFQLIDDAHDHDGIAAVLGFEAAAREAERHLDEALRAIASFGPQAQGLRGMARWLQETL